MIYVGIDIAKLNHFASAIDSDGTLLIEPFKFLNDNDGFYSLLSKLNPFEKDSIIIGLESTAHYGNNLVFLPCLKRFSCLYDQSYSDIFSAEKQAPQDQNGQGRYSGDC